MMAAPQLHVYHCFHCKMSRLCPVVIVSLLSIGCSAHRPLLALRGGRLKPPKPQQSVITGSTKRAAEPIDFNVAWSAARRALNRGESTDTAMEAAEAVLAGESFFEPLDSFPGARLGRQWLDDTNATLLQHEVITATPSAWVGSGIAAPRKLSLRAPLVPWADALAQRLSPEFGGLPPDACEVTACESGQSVSLTTPSDINGSTSVVLSLYSEVTLASSFAQTAIPPRSALLLSSANDDLHMNCSQRHLSIRFWRVGA